MSRMRPPAGAPAPARRAYDAKLEARLRGWKPLSIWYAFCASLLAIGGISALGAGQVGVFFGCIVACALCLTCVHYLYNCGRRRVWFIFW